MSTQSQQEKDAIAAILEAADAVNAALEQARAADYGFEIMGPLDVALASLKHALKVATD